eukprot:TRINITY_DN2770_c2_g1_i1.p1 TRINITY_DN2770_c2_g1~~TRINITY_DN2770_c2_g1_i1.p1  ORF type:complete len:121 (+),score=12.76 TRINITY_DN2770_c2_g1_i1:205-567(+)
MNGIMFYCAGGGSVTSGVSQWGNYGNTRYCPGGSYISQYKIKVESDQGGGDDTAANAVRVKCSDGTELATNNEGPWGSWSSWKGCPNNGWFCGVRTQTQSPGGDDWSLVDIMVKCCYTVR